ncbi:nuclear transport factor 2 family protein [Tomitella fengzijianii]|uniref:Nuclear transport factor 2 family protein n=1 Tax=Tomitella fengzijianii TaxID=2597660 RepID=A0A516WZQ8_9ACTN|nr:nuclear transport factor 2 family protein [Tomitella fengzijianii]QDQ96336.1 nuclear transport factor 2 family protein [Tomitella fengzijianii]
MTTATLTLSPAEQLLAVEEIKRTFAGRLRCMDTKDWESYATFHTDDVVSDSWRSQGAAQPSSRSDSASTGDAAPVTGGAALTAAIRATLDGDRPVTSVHHGHTPEIELTSDTTARGVWAMEDLLRWTRTGGDAGADENTDEWLHGYGHYHEEYRKVGGRWLISYRALTRLRVDTSPGFYDR